MLGDEGWVYWCADRQLWGGHWGNPDLQCLWTSHRGRFQPTDVINVTGHEFGESCAKRVLASCYKPTPEHPWWGVGGAKLKPHLPERKFNRYCLKLKHPEVAIKVYYLDIWR